jgi:hypothetical protein
MNWIAKRHKWATGPIAVLTLLLTAGVCRGRAQTRKQNILVIMGDDIGMWNIGVYHRGPMAGTAPKLEDLDELKVQMATRMAQAQAAAKGPSN